MRRINELPEREFTSNDIDNCFYVQDFNQPSMCFVRMEKVFEWIKNEAIKNGLTVQLVDDRILLSSNETKQNLS